MQRNFEQLWTDLNLDTLSAPLRLQSLKDWCNQHISQDILYSGEGSFELYLALAKDFLQSFIPAAQAHPLLSSDHFYHLTPVQYAAYRGFDRFFESLRLSEDNQLSTEHGSNLSLLHLAAQYGNVHTVDILLAKGALATETNQSLQLPLHRALVTSLACSEQSKGNKAMIARKLWQTDPSTLAFPDIEGNTAVHLMAKYGYDALMHDVLGSYPEGAMARNHSSQYPIHLAILNNHRGCVSHLLSLPEVASMADSKHRVAIHYAACFGDKVITDLCYQATENPDVADSEGNTAMTLANQAQNHAALEVLNAHTPRVK